MKERGVCFWFDRNSGYGFVTDAKGENIFVHHSGVLGEPGYRNLTKGSAVEFERSERNGRFVAINVCQLEALRGGA